VLRGNGGIDHFRIKEIAEGVNYLNDLGKEVIIVSSGAIVSGKTTGDIYGESIPVLQAYASVGQIELMDSYRDAFSEYGKRIGQILVTREDLSNSGRVKNFRNTIDTLVSNSVVPIINENDAISYDEITFGDNDLLSALVACSVDSDGLWLLTDVDGLYEQNPQMNSNARLIKNVHDIDAIEKYAKSETNGFGKGGMKSKILAANKCYKSRIYSLICNGKKDGIIRKVFDECIEGTLVYPK